MTDYKIVEKTFSRLSHLSHLRSIVGWDEAVMMPTGGGEARAAAVSDLAQMMVETIQSPDLGKAIEKAETNSDLNEWQRANLHEAKSAHIKAVAVDPELVARQAKEAMACEQIWRKLRAKNNWQDFKGPFSRLVSLAQEEARQRAKATGESPYQAMVSLYEPGMKLETIDKSFSVLRSELPGLIESVLEAQSRRPKVELGRKVPVAKQRKCVLHFMKWLGFDFEHGRIDESHHPFCGGVPQDVRITTRYSEDDYLMGLMGVLHETGHALYEQGLPKEWLEQPVGSARGMAFHESQSLFVEMQISRSREFAEFALPILKEYLAEEGDPASYWTVENIFRQLCHVEKGFIRVDADEVTYPAHVILRYEIEKALIEGDLKVDELPKIWNEKMKSYLHLETVGNDKEGCMQDVHWPSGAFGYFPSYTLGALTASQLFTALSKSYPNARKRIANGEIGEIKSWLSEKVWSQGSKYSSDELIKRATGESLNVQHFLNHIKSRYLS